MAAVLPGTWGDPDGRQGLIWSLVAHGVLLFLILFGSLLLPSHEPVRELGIKATVVEGRTAPKKRTAPKPVETPPPAPAPEPDRRAEEAERQREQERRAEEQRQEQKKVEQRKAEEQKKVEQKKLADAKAAEAKQAEAAKARAKAEADAKAKAEARAKAEADKQAAAKAEQQRKAEEARRREAADLARQLEEEEALLAAENSGAIDDYMNLINQKVKRNWIKPPSARPGVECEVQVTQIPGGEVVDVRVGRCEGDEALRKSVEMAFRRASPLPLPDDPKLFKRSLSVLFKPEA